MITFTLVFNFDAPNAGKLVEAQIFDSTFTPLAAYTTAGIVEAGAGQYAGTFTVAPGFIGFVRGRLQATPAIADTYAVNFAAPPPPPATTGNALTTQVFNFQATNAGQIVEAQALDSTFTPLAPYSAAGIIESGAGQYVGTFSLPAGFFGFVRARLRATPAIVDTYAIGPASGSAAQIPSGQIEIKAGTALVSLAVAKSVLSASSTEYIHAPLSATDTGNGASVDLTAYPVSLALTQGGTPVFVVATWLQRTATPAGTYAHLLVGPGGSQTLTPGCWRVYSRLTLGVETCVRPHGFIVVTA